MPTPAHTGANDYSWVTCGPTPHFANFRRLKNSSAPGVLKKARQLTSTIETTRQLGRQSN
jgi:hypothetical protein